MTLTFCAGCDESLSDIGPTPGLQPTFSTIQREIFQSTDSAGRVACVNSHNPSGPPFARDLNLTADAAHESLVDAPSFQRPERLRVAPGNPDASYLIRKIEAAPSEPIEGVRMPAAGPPYLTDTQVMVIREWIQRGAPND